MKLKASLTPDSFSGSTGNTSSTFKPSGGSRPPTKDCAFNSSRPLLWSWKSAVRRPLLSKNGWSVRGVKASRDSRRLDRGGIIDHHLFPEGSIVFHKCLVNGMVLVGTLPLQVVEKNEFRNVVACIYYRAGRGMGRDAYVDRADGFNFFQCFDTFDQLVAVFGGFRILQPEEHMVNHSRFFSLHRSGLCSGA